MDDYPEEEEKPKQPLGLRLSFTWAPAAVLHPASTQHLQLYKSRSQIHPLNAAQISTFSARPTNITGPSHVVIIGDNFTCTE